MRNWSPLASRADLPRRLPGAGAGTSSLFYGAPRVGTFWTSGNPAGLVDGVRDKRSDFAAAWSRQAGDYRRPLDAGATGLTQVSAQSWQGFGDKFSMLGRVSYAQERLSPGTRSDFTEAFGSSPFLTTDTSLGGVRRTRALLEGGAGWRLGSWGIGVTTGYEARDHATILSGAVRTDRVATPGIVAGLSRKLRSVEVGVFGRVRHASETIFLVPRAEQIRVFELTGYREAPPFDLGGIPYNRRRLEDMTSGGATLSGSLGGARWSVYGERSRLRERLTRQTVNNPANDSWDADGWTGGGALQASLGSRLLLTLQGRATSLSGNGNLALDSAGVIFHADESSVETEAELRFLPAETGWMGTLTLGLAHESRIRRDSTAQLATDVTTTTPSISVEMGRRLGGRLFASVGGAFAPYGPTSTLPNPASRGPVYQYYFAGEYALYASSAHPMALSLLLTYQVSKKADLWLSARSERLASSETGLKSPFLPLGTRTATSLMGGVTVR